MRKKQFQESAKCLLQWQLPR